MTGQIPKYGANFTHQRVDYDPVLASTIYVLKADANWHIRSDKTSKKWWVFVRGVQVGGPFPAMRDAMTAAVSAREALQP